MEPGTVVGDRFVIEREAGAGGMGTVYAALDKSTGERVALKILGRSTSVVTERFVRETRTLAEIDHPGVVRYVAHGTTATGQSYLAMEWLEGEDLSARLSRKGLRLAETVRVVRGAAEALAALHRRGIVHRDVKPANLFLIGDAIDRVKLVDLGIVRVRSTSATLTRVGSFVGTPGYIAPEQARGGAEVGPPADVFALGCVLFECLTGTPAFQGETVMALLAKILLVDPPRPRDVRDDVPAPLDDLCAWMMRREVEARPRDAGEVAEALAKLERAEPADAPPPTAREERRRTPGLTSGEQRLVCLVLAGDERADTTIEGDWFGATEAEGAVPDELVKLRTRASALGVRLERLADGTLLGMPQREANATEQAIAAARAALLLRAEMPAVPIALGTGRGDVTSPVPVGDVIDRAARNYRQSKRAPAPRPIVIDEITASLASERFEIARAGDAHVLVSELPDARTGARTVLGKDTPFVGRSRELGMLEALVAECVVEGVARAVLVTAPAGFGKSRLRRELVARARAATGDLSVWIGRGDPMQTGAAFGLLGRALRDAVGIAEGETADSARAKIRARLERVTVPDVDRATAFACELVGVVQSDERPDLAAARRDLHVMHDQLRATWLAWLDAETRAGPVLLVLEDLQWGDATTVSFVDDALRLLADRPLCVLAVARPEVEQVFPRLWAERSLQPLPLRELSKRASETLARHVLGAATNPSLVEGIVARAGGNAFFLEELLRSAADHGGSELPETVLAMVEARLDALDPGARLVLRAASVFGETFHAGGVAALVGDDAVGASVPEWLAVLARKETVVERETSSLPGETELVFRHALVREAAYAMLTDDDRRLGHRLAATWLESKGVGDAALLAEHFARGGVADRAASFFLASARQALGGNDPAGALEKAERGLAEARDDRAMRAELLLVVAEARLWRAEIEPADAAASEAMGLVGEGSDAWWTAIGHRLEATTKLAHVDEALGISDRIRRALDETTHASATVIRAATAAAHVGVDLGRYEITSDVLYWIDRHAPTDALSIARTAEARARLLLSLGDVEGHREYGARAVSAYESAGAMRAAAHASGGLAYSSLVVGRFEEAVDALVRARDLGQAIGATASVLMAEHNLGLALLRLGRLDEAFERESIALDLARGRKIIRMEGACHYYLSLIEHARARHASAEACAREAVRACEDLPPSRAEGLSALAQACLAQGKIDEARGACEEAMRILCEVGSIDEGEPFIRLTYATVMRAAGEVEASLQAIALAARLIEERAGKLRDPSLRDAFLAIPEHARTLELAAAWR